MSNDIKPADPFHDNFKAFLWAAWKHLGLPPPTDVQLDIADYLQYGPRRKVIMAFRGVGKSWITATFVLWLLYRNPQSKILVVSASKQRADDFSTFCMRMLLEWPLIQHLYPKDDQRCSKIAFDVRPAKADHAPSVKSAGITGQITGSRADHIVADDIEVVNNSDTQMARDKLAELVKEFDAVLKPGDHTTITYLGTPQNEMSLYNQLPERGYAVRIWPARIPKPDAFEKYGVKLAPFVTEQMARGLQHGDVLDPKRFNNDDLLERELSYGRSGFALQFMLDTSLSDADKFPLRLVDLIVMPLNPEKGPIDLIWTNTRDSVLEGVPVVGLDGDKYHGPMFMPDKPELFAAYTGSVMFIDPAGRGKDEVGYAIVNILMGRLFLMDAGGIRGGYSEENLTRLMKTAKDFKVNLVLVEPNFGDGMFAHILKAVSQRVYPVKIEDAEWSRAQKEARIIDTLEPVMNQHRLVVSQELIERDYKSTSTYPAQDQNRCRLFYQMTRMTKDKGALYVDDRIDALAGAVAYWLAHMARESGKALKEHHNKTLQAELDSWLRGSTSSKTRQTHVVGKRPVASNPTMKGIKSLKKNSIRMR